MLREEFTKALCWGAVFYLPIFGRMQSREEVVLSLRAKGMVSSRHPPTKTAMAPCRQLNTASLGQNKCKFHWANYNQSHINKWGFGNGYYTCTILKISPQ